MHNYIRPTSQRIVWWILIVILLILNSLVKPWIDLRLLQVNESVRSLLSMAVPAIFGLTLVPWAYNRCLWKIFSRFEHIPQLDGTWEIRGKSSHTKDEDGKPSCFWDGTLSIDQDWNVISIRVKTDNASSESSMAVIKNKGRGIYVIQYIYDNTPTVENWAKHMGVATLEFDMKDKCYTGTYFNFPRDRQTWGTMEGEKTTKKP